MTLEDCKKGKHAYISSHPKPRWCIWCNTKEKVKAPAALKKATNRKPTTRRSK